MLQRWTLETLDGAQSYVFEINPNAQDSPIAVRQISWNFNEQAGWAGTRAGRAPHPWSFSGVLRSQAQYDALIAWANKKKKVKLTDDRGDVFYLRVLTFAPTQIAGARARNAPWRWTYTVQALVFDGGTL